MPSLGLRDLMRVPQSAPDESGEEVPSDVGARGATQGRTMKVVGVCSVLAILALATFGTSGNSLAHVDIKKFTGLSTHHCQDFPRIKLRKTLRSNLGNQGPDHHEPEGILYLCSDYEDEDKDKIHLHINTVGGKDYVAAFPSDNGIYGHFGDVNMRGGNNATLIFKVTDVHNKPITIPEFDISFFDVDIGEKDGKNTSEALTIYPGWTAVYVSSETQLLTIKNPNGDNEDAVMYKASMLGQKRDSPKDPEVLTAWQFNKAITLRYDNFQEGKITMHAFGPGTSGRYFNFILEPTILCVDAGVKPQTILAVEETPAPAPAKKEEPAEDTCCLLMVASVTLVCTEKSNKQFYHFMCTDNGGEAPAPAPDGEEEEEECCVIALGPVNLACTAKDQKQWYHFMCKKK